MSPGTDVQPFIDTAEQVVTDNCTASRYSVAKLELIERWLSAHFYGIYDAQLRAAKAGTVNVEYQYKIAFGFANTMWGQQALRIDSAGNLAKLDNTTVNQRKIVVSIKNLGSKRGNYGYGLGYWGII